MKDLNAMLRDYTYVKRAIQNPENNHSHSKALHEVVTIFRKKWNDYRFAMYYYSLYDFWRELDEKLFDEKIKKIQEAK